MSQRYVDSSLRRYVDGYRINNATIGDSSHILSGRRILYGADEDLDRILVGLDTDQIESVAHDVDCPSLLAAGNTWAHHIIDQSLHDVDRGFSEALVFVSTAGVWKENGAS